MRFGEKFGASMKDAANLAKYAESKGQEISGVSFHVGSGCAAPSQYTKAIAQANSLLNTDPKAKTIDIGGGFTDTHIEAASKAVALGKELLADDVRLIAEPGRFFAETSHDLFVKVIGKKPSANGKGFRYTIDESLYGQFSCIPFDHAQPRWIRISYCNHKRKAKPAILYGRTCDSVDMIASAQEAEELCEGDWLWFPNMGAYTTVTSTEFNGFPKPPLIILDKYADEQLPPTQSFTQSEWPSGLQYVSAVTCPTFS
jgi:ornithine decarboxylase